MRWRCCCETRLDNPFEDHPLEPKNRPFGCICALWQTNCPNFTSYCSFGTKSLTKVQCHLYQLLSLHNIFILKSLRRACLSQSNSSYHYSAPPDFHWEALSSSTNLRSQIRVPIAKSNAILEPSLPVNCSKSPLKEAISREQKCRIGMHLNGSHLSSDSSLGSVFGPCHLS